MGQVNSYECNCCEKANYIDLIEEIYRISTQTLATKMKVINSINKQRLEVCFWKG